MRRLTRPRFETFLRLSPSRADVPTERAVAPELRDAAVLSNAEHHEVPVVDWWLRASGRTGVGSGIAHRASENSSRAAVGMM